MNSRLPPGEKTYFGHPVGLFYLSFTEAWERFSYYGMLSLLALYMTKQLLLPQHVDHVFGFAGYRAALEAVYGHLTPLALATNTVGLYTAGVYATPLLGGLLADRVLGRTRTVTLGAILMALGHFLMAFDVSFLLALLCLLLGVGCFKGNLATQVGDLYDKADNRRADAFQFYMFGIQVAVVVAPIVTGGLAQEVAWHWGFGAAGVGMLIGLAVYLLGRKHLPAETMIVRGAPKEDRPKLAPGEGKTIAVLVALLPVLAIGAIGNQQINNAYLIWGDANLQLNFFGFSTPVSWLMSVDAFFGAVTMAGSVAFWRWYGTRWTEPDEITKLTIGTAIAASAPLFLVAASLHPAGHRASIGWALAFHLVNDIGFSNLFPVGLALYSRAAPRAIGGTMIAIYYVYMVACNALVGWLGGFLDKMPGATFWIMHAAIIAVSALLLLMARSLAGRVLTPKVDPEEALAPA
jgi:POT family proton-dependent oligopeptide transporter